MKTQVSQRPNHFSLEKLLRQNTTNQEPLFTKLVKIRQKGLEIPRVFNVIRVKTINHDNFYEKLARITFVAAQNFEA